MHTRNVWLLMEVKMSKISVEVLELIKELREERTKCLINEFGGEE